MGIHLTYKLPTTNKRPHTPRRSVWCYSLGDFDKASEILHNADWDTVTNESDIDLCRSNWQRTYLSKQSNVVYRIPCSCGQAYIGETKRRLETRLKEHRDACEKGMMEKSAVAEHAWENHHLIDWEDTWEFI